jgi:hypothetical protein
MEPVRPIDDFTNDELRHYACEHVLYEITHFFRAIQGVETAPAGFPMNFAIEVFALHLRNLLDFLAPRENVRRTDACARHFFTNWEEPELDAVLTKARWMADKHIAHLTTDRTDDPEQKEWPIQAIFESIVPTIERFSEGADLVCDTFRDEVAARLAELRPPAI